MRLPRRPRRYATFAEVLGTLTTMPGETQSLPVAVVIAAHNRVEWVGQAVASALGQRPHPPAEVIVVDDGSTDDTAGAAERAGAIVVRHETNRGAATARNSGATSTNQPWIAPLDSDDRWLPHMLSTLWPLRGEHGFVAGASLAVNSDNTPLSYGGLMRDGPLVLDSPAPLVYPENFIAASGVIIRRETFLEAGTYRTNLRSAEDFDLWLRMLALRTGLCVPTVVTVYRVHEAQKSRGKAASRDAVLDIIADYRDSEWFRDELVEQRRAVMAWDELREAYRARSVAPALSTGRWILSRPERCRALLGALRRRRERRQRAQTWAARLALPDLRA
jgi:glycosyltransferase involved in cell wall biosynthesis